MNNELLFKDSNCIAFKRVSVSCNIRFSWTFALPSPQYWQCNKEHNKHLETIFGGIPDTKKPCHNPSTWGNLMIWCRIILNQQWTWALGPLHACLSPGEPFSDFPAAPLLPLLFPTQIWCLCYLEKLRHKRKSSISKVPPLSSLIYSVNS